MKRAFVVSLQDVIVFAEDYAGAVDEAVAIATDGGLSIDPITTRQLRAHGSVYPCIPWDPDREMTCAEIADAMDAAAAAPPEQTAPVIDLMAALKASLAKGRQ